MELLIRSARPPDAERVVALWAAAEAVASATDDPDSVRGLIAHDDDALVVAERDGELVGSLIVGWDGWRGSLYRLAVHPDHRRRGVATALAREGEERLRGRGCVRISAIVVGSDDVATSFWTAAGYAVAPGQLRFTKTFGERS